MNLCCLSLAYPAFDFDGEAVAGRGTGGNPLDVEACTFSNCHAGIVAGQVSIVNNDIFSVHLATFKYKLIIPMQVFGYATDSCLAASLYQEEWVLMGGCVKPPGQEGYALLLTKADIDGAPDPTFGNDGKAIIDLPTRDEMVTHIRPLADGSILIGGNILYEGYSFYAPDSTDIFVGRLLPNGQVDSTFGTDGFIYQRFDRDCKSSILGDMEIDGNGRILVTGGSFSPYPGEYGIDCPNHIVICRYLLDGQPDPSFGENGIVELSNRSGRAASLLIEEDGRILVTGLISISSPKAMVYEIKNI